MKKIEYPYSNQKDEDLFVNDYFEVISQFIPNQVEICNDIKKIDPTWNLKKIITASFSDLLLFNELAKNHISILKNINDRFCWKNSNNKNHYLYEDVQRDISDFLINKGINIKSCHYCNIDFINSFSEELLFNDFEELLNHAPRKMMEKIDGISKPTINKIIKERKNKLLSIIHLTLLFPRIHKDLIDILRNELNKTINLKFEHFTLDHVLSKGEFPYLSLSIYNLVPSCYSCNSKFKHEKEFTINDSLKKIIPSSQDYNCDDFFEFIVKFKTKYQIKNKDDINVDLTNKSGNVSTEEYTSMFKLKGRYEFHKNISFEMIDKRKVYSDSQIKEIARLLKRDVNTVKIDIFGRECFESNNLPFEKYKQDIAKQLGLI